MYNIIYNNIQFFFIFFEKNIKLYYIIYFLIFLDRYINLLLPFITILKLIYYLNFHMIYNIFFLNYK